MAPRAGLEPATQWLTATCSTNWAIGELLEDRYSTDAGPQGQ